MRSFEHEQFLERAGRQFNSDPFVTLEHLARVADMPLTEIRRHYPTVEAVQRDVAESALDRWEASVRATQMIGAPEVSDRDELDRSLRHLLGCFVADTADDGYLLNDRFLCNFPDLQERVRALRASEIELYRRAQQSGLLTDRVPPEWVVVYVNGLLVAAREALSWAPRRSVHQFVLQSFYDGLRAS
jgi:AcrR family transcriptional regulator